MPLVNPFRECITNISSYILHHGVIAISRASPKFPNTICKNLSNLSNVTPTNKQLIADPNDCAVMTKEISSNEVPVIICRSIRAVPVWDKFQPCKIFYKICIKAHVY